MSTQHCTINLFLNFVYIWIVKSTTITGSDFTCNSYQECYQDIIICDANKNCTITCSGSGSCRYSNILCPINGNCTINCENQVDTCRQATINATASTSLHLNCFDTITGYRGCDDTNVYCPNNGHSGPITCNIYVGQGAANGGLADIYAVEGFNDVEFTGNVGSISGSSIHCTETYLTQCSLSSSSPTPYQCNECANILIPTAMPTKIPTIPPTETPSKYPTYIPTFIPTSNPTIEPTNNPTIEPTITTNYPSINPTKIPTISPTPSPTIILRFHDPTIAPSIEEYGLDTTLITGLVTDGNNNSSKEQNKGMFSKPSNVIILVLSIIVFQLLCIVGMCMFKKYRQRRKETDDPDMIVIQMNSNDKVNNMPKTAIAMQSASGYSVSDKDNIDTGMLMDMNIDEGADENGKNVLMVQETPQYGNGNDNNNNKNEMKMDNSLSESSNLNIQKK
eukprot:426822_1